MRWIVGARAVAKAAASTSQMGRFETEFLAVDENLAAWADLSGQWIDRAHAGHPPKAIVLDMDSSVSPTHGDQQGTAYNGHFSQRVKFNRRTLDRQISSMKMGDRFADDRIRTGFAFDRHNCYASDDCGGSFGKSGIRHF